MEDILLIDKPKGITSFDVIRILRKKLNIRKMGHAGTLDPLASGLMIIGINRGTKRLNEYLKLPKVYEVHVLLGKKTTTGDLEGDILESKKVSEVDLKEVKKIIKEIKGKLTLPVPLYSAIKIKGTPLYKHARKGHTIQPPKKEMEIINIKLKNHFKKDDFYILDLEIKVASGTYIRSIAEEIGKRLNLPATVAQLRRTQIGRFKIEEAEKLPDRI
ncbi:MAG: tRNA pseudouridine(55) synthase TruB [Candidatus Levyibacteriota bacterium]